MNGKVKNQHYVPRMYIKRFASTKNKICVWNLITDNILSNQKIERYATKRYYYDTNEMELKQALEQMSKLYPNILSIIDTKDSQFVEKGLSRMENDVSKILDLICSKHEVLYDETNMLKIIIFLHDLAYRAEKFRDQVDNINKVHVEHLKRFGISSESIKRISKTGKEQQLYQLVGIVPLLETTEKLINNYNWYIGTVSGKMKFIISDNPAQGIMLGFNDICIPLSGNISIILRNNDPRAHIISEDIPQGDRIQLSEKSVFVYNAIQLSYANRFIFGDMTSLSFLKMTKENSR